jgi:hypothetical protein
VPDVFANDFGTLLGGSATSGAGTLTVEAPAPTALQGGPFRIRVEDVDADGKPAGTHVEYMLVTAGQSGTSWTVTRGQEGTSAVAHAAGSLVTHVLTAAGLLAAVQQNAGFGRTVVWDVDANAYPPRWLNDTSQPREFVGPVDPETIGTITGPVLGDRWTPTAAAP